MEDGRVLRVKFKPGVSPQKRFEGVVRILTDLIEDGMRDDYVRQKAVQIIKQAGVQGHNELGEIRAITKWVQRNAHYVKDPHGVEFFFTARRQLKDIDTGKHSGDCDDFVILGGALLGSIGYPVGALIVDSNNDGIFNHVMLVTKTFSPTKEFGDQWIPIELIYPQFQIGESVPISRIYPLMANVETARTPIMRKAISGLKGILGHHPVGRLAGFGTLEPHTHDPQTGQMLVPNEATPGPAPTPMPVPIPQPEPEGNAMTEDQFLDMIRQISETDNQAIILNATSMMSTPAIFAGATIRDILVVKTQIDSAIAQARLNSTQRAYLENIRSLLIERISVLDTTGAYEGTIDTPSEQGVFGLSGLKGYFGVM
jgi:hypothetical protein